MQKYTTVAILLLCAAGAMQYESESKRQDKNKRIIDCIREFTAINLSH